MSFKRIAMSIWVVTLASMSLATPSSAQPRTNAASDQSSDIVVPVFGTSMVITIVTNASGAFVSADISPAGPPAMVLSLVSGDSTGPEALGVFEIKFGSGDPSVEITVRLDDGTTTTDNHAAVAGDQQWVGDPLGNDDIVVVGYTLGSDAAGQPTIEINSVNGTDPAKPGVVASAGEITWYQILVPTINNGHLFQFITFFDVPDNPANQVSTNLTFDVVVAGGQSSTDVSLTDPNAASTINGTATPRREHEDDDDEHEDEHERDD